MAFALVGAGLFLWAAMQIPEWFAATVMNAFVVLQGAAVLFIVGAVLIDGFRARAAGRADEMPWAGFTAADGVIALFAIGVPLLAAVMTVASYR